MGIIQRQSIKGSIYSYIGAFLGFVNLAILAPKIFTTDQIGLTQVLVSLATIFAQLGTLGQQEKDQWNQQVNIIRKQS